jgi:hypothetical protein
MQKSLLKFLPPSLIKETFSFLENRNKSPNKSRNFSKKSQKDGSTSERMGIP